MREFHASMQLIDGKRTVWAESVPDYIQVHSEFLVNSAPEHVKVVQTGDDGITLYMTFENGEAIYRLYNYDLHNEVYDGKLLSWKQLY